MYVSILVLLDESLEECPKNRLKCHIGVSILVLLDESLEAYIVSHIEQGGRFQSLFSWMNRSKCGVARGTNHYV